MSDAQKQKSATVIVGARSYDIAVLDYEAFTHELASRSVTNEFIKSFIDYDDQLVVVNDSLKSDHKRELIIHELLHACLEDSGAEINDKISEQLIRALSPRLNQLLSAGLIETLDSLT